MDGKPRFPARFLLNQGNDCRFQQERLAAARGDLRRRQPRSKTMEAPWPGIRE